MSFYADNNRIHVMDGLVDVFDTNTPMPHITQVMIANSISVGFPNPPKGMNHTHWTTQEWNNENVCRTRTICRNRYGCELEYVCSPQYVCKPATWPQTGQVCGWENVCGYQNVCKDRYSCQPEYTCEIEAVLRVRYFCDVRRRVDALDWEQVTVLGNISPAVAPDFFVINVSGARTAAGAQADYGTFVSAVPGSPFVCQGSAILESAFVPGGASWLRRIMSVYIENGQLKVKFKHSNRQYNSNMITGQANALDNQPSAAFIHAPDSFDEVASSFTFNFTVYIGKFTR